MNTIAQNTPLCKVFYDRSAGEYIVRNGRELGRFPRGKANKTLAQWLAIDHDAPDVARIARKMLADGIADEGRLIRAARLVIEGKITDHVHDGDYIRTQVTASEGNRSPVTGLPQYQVVHNLKWTCECEDYRRNQAAGSQHKCKHILVVMIHQALEAERRDFEAAATRKRLDLIERGRGRRPGHTYDIAPGDGGISDQDLDSGPTPEYQRMLAQEMTRRKRAEALPASVDQVGSIEDMLGYDDDIPFDGRPMHDGGTWGGHAAEYGLQPEF